jgi:hypothetical protein
MAPKVIDVVEPFISFAMTFNVVVAHNMCVLQLNPRFKVLYCIVEYVGRDRGVIVVEEYDQHVLLLLLVVVSKHFNPRCVEDPPPSTPINDDSLLGVASFIKENDLSLVKFELSCIIAYMWMITM